MAVIALVDCNNFYASCEKLFDPTIADRPIVVLSNNDGCVVARSAEAKALGVPMGAPWFQLQELAKAHDILALSSNYALYADMSSRVVHVLAGFTPAMEIYRRVLPEPGWLAYLARRHWPADPGACGPLDRAAGVCGHRLNQDPGEAIHAS